MNKDSTTSSGTDDDGEPAPVISTGSVTIDRVKLRYAERGSGRPVLLLHGGILTSHIWHRVMPALGDDLRAIAVELSPSRNSLRQGDEDADARAWHAYADQLGGFVDALDLDDQIILVMHGYSSLIGLEWARHNAAQLRGVALVEAITTPLEWNDVDEVLARSVRRSRSPDGRRYIAGSDEFFNETIAAQTLRPLLESVIEDFRGRLGPFGNKRRTTLLQAFRDLPIGGVPSDVEDHLAEIRDWLDSTTVPQLVMSGDPGYLPNMLARKSPRGPGLRTTTRVRGGHLLPIEVPALAGTFLRLWFDHLDMAPPRGSRR